jgi:hypothetical protein
MDKPSKQIITARDVPEHPVSSVVQPLSFGRHRDFKLEDSASGYVYETPTIKPIRLTKKEILESANALIDSPFSVGVHYITSVVDDARASLFASFVARRAHYLYLQGFPSKRRSQLGFPRFEYVYGNYKHVTGLIDMFRNTQPPATLVLAGLDIQSSDAKTDAFRDVLYAASRMQTCVMVVASGCTPHQLQFDKLRIMPASHIHLGYPDLIKSADI